MPNESTGRGLSVIPNESSQLIARSVQTNMPSLREVSGDAAYGAFYYSASAGAVIGGIAGLVAVIVTTATVCPLVGLSIIVFEAPMAVGAGVGLVSFGAVGALIGTIPLTVISYQTRTFQLQDTIDEALKKLNEVTGLVEQKKILDDLIAADRKKSHGIRSRFSQNVRDFSIHTKTFQNGKNPSDRQVTDFQLLLGGNSYISKYAKEWKQSHFVDGEDIKDSEYMLPTEEIIKEHHENRWAEFKKYMGDIRNNGKSLFNTALEVLKVSTLENDTINLYSEINNKKYDTMGKGFFSAKVPAGIAEMREVLAKGEPVDPKVLVKIARNRLDNPISRRDHRVTALYKKIISSMENHTAESSLTRAAQ